MTGYFSCFDATTDESVAPTPLAKSSDLDELLKSLEGAVYEFGDDGYERARLGTVWTHDACKPGEGRRFSPASHPTETWNVDACGFPAAICVVAGVADVRACVAYCARSGAALAVCGGRHSHHCMKQNALVVDLQRLRACELVDVGGAPRLRCGGGALNGDAHQALDGSGLCLTLGHHPGTGIGGLVQQGGHGPLEKIYGLSIDAMVSAEVVCADAQVRRCSAAEEPELFWALRGGCANFGVVTQFEFAPRPFERV